MINRILGFTKISRSGRLHNVTEVMSPITPKVFDLIFLLADPLCLLESCYSRCYSRSSCRRHQSYWKLPNVWDVLDEHCLLRSSG